MSLPCKNRDIFFFGSIFDSKTAIFIVWHRRRYLTYGTNM